MALIRDLYQSADWKTEKHVPVIDAADAVDKGKSIKIAVTVGKEVAHPNITEHHIAWIEVYFLAEGDKFPCCLAKIELGAHGASAQGPNMSTIYTESKVCLDFKTEKPGAILAASYCNIHGLWESSKELKVK